MKKLGNHLRRHLDGEILDSENASKYFSTDGSILELKPKLVIYPKSVADIRKVARFSWQLAERGKIMPITARGKGTDQAGAAIGEGIILVFPAHMNKIIQMDKDTVSVQPGIIYDSLQKTLHTHGRFLPPYPSSSEFSTIGGAVANNAAGEKTVKYGDTRKYTQELEVVLANGEIIKTEKLSKRDLDKKMGLSTFEGEIYRQLDGLIMDNWELIQNSRPITTKSSSGYNLWDVKDNDGSFDLTPLIVGSQGTLGVVAQVQLKTEEYQPQTHLIAASFDSVENAEEAVLALRQYQPSALEIVDKNLLEMVNKEHPKHLTRVIKKPFPDIILLVEFDDSSDRKRKKNIKKSSKILDELSTSYKVSEDPDEQEELWSIRHSAAAVIWHNRSKAKALPIIEDGVVPVDRMKEFLETAYAIFNKHNLDIAVWGHAGDGNLHMQPFIDLGSVGGQQKVLKIMDDFYKKVIELGGVPSAEHNDGRLRGMYLKDAFGEEMYEIFQRTKEIFDPYGILNPGVKINVNKDKIKGMMRKSYSMEHLHDHMPRM